MTRVRVLFTRAFWLDALERAIKTAAQAAILAHGADKALNAMTADWANVGAMALGGAALSVLMSVASANVSGLSPASIVPPGA